MQPINIILGDIVDLEVDAIVNAANPSLLGGGGVDGAIHRAAGPALLASCRGLGGCKTGEVKLTPGFNLTANYIAHTVGPIWRGGHAGEPQLLRSCYLKCLELATRLNLSSIAFPAISTGAYGYPLRQATEIALRTAMGYVEMKGSPEITFVCFDEPLYELYLNTSIRLKQDNRHPDA